MKTVQVGEGKSAHELIHLPNRLKQKVGEGGIDPRRLAEAETAVQELGANYLDWANEDLATLHGKLGALMSGETPQAEALEAVFSVAHDMRAQGGTFGYPLVTRIGRSLCRFIEALESAGKADLELVAAHVDAITAVLRNQIAGDSDPVSQKLAEGLEVAVSKRQAR